MSGLLDFDEWGSHCPICKLITEHEDWPRLLECGDIDSDEVKRGEMHPACIVCGSHELEEQWLTTVTKNMAGMSHVRLMRCRSCGTGRSQDGVDAVTGKPIIKFHHPPELDHKKIVEEIQRHLDQGEENEELLKKAKFAIAVDAFFRPQQFYCLDTGWDVMGYGVRPLERTEIMKRFYEWTNREAMGESDLEDNPLLKKEEKRSKKKWWN